MCGFKPVESLSEGTYRVPFDSASGEGPCLAGAREYAALSPPTPGLSFPLFNVSPFGECNHLKLEWSMETS